MAQFRDARPGDEPERVAIFEFTGELEGAV
jgi:hypothetical protein